MSFKRSTVSKQTDVDSHYDYTDQDWSASIFFLNQIASQVLTNGFPKDVDILKIDVPIDANEQTECEFSEISDQAYYKISLDSPHLGSKIGDTKISVSFNKNELPKNSDIYVLAVKKRVSVCPMKIYYHHNIKLNHMQYILEQPAAN